MIRTVASSVDGPRRVLRCGKCCRWRDGRVLQNGRRWENRVVGVNSMISL
jgi:hypothetical protein